MVLVQNGECVTMEKPVPCTKTMMKKSNEEFVQRMSVWVMNDICIILKRNYLLQILEISYWFAGRLGERFSWISFCCTTRGLQRSPALRWNDAYAGDNNNNKDDEDEDEERWWKLRFSQGGSLTCKEVFLRLAPDINGQLSHWTITNITRNSNVTYSLIAT